MKNIVICADGTGNSAVKGRGTNVFKLFEAVDVNGHRRAPGVIPQQVAIYDEGVGTEDFVGFRVTAAMTGRGLQQKIRRLYRELARLYEKGDRLYLFGFSRGAFTVRALVSVIAQIGIIEGRRCDGEADLRRVVLQAHRLFERARRRSWTDDRIVADLAAFQARYCCRAEIDFIGVWDTVDAVGMPFDATEWLIRRYYPYKFRDYHLPLIVRRACHALALDEERRSFRPVIWTMDDGLTDRIEQVWFAGVHSDVGGGYERHGVSLISLDWMMARAEADGLRFEPSARAAYAEHHSFSDMLHDSRLGLGLLYRWKPRDVAALSRAHGLTSAIHVSVFERLAHGLDGYAPGNIPPRCRVVTTQVDEHGVGEAVAAAIGAAHPADAPLDARFASSIRIGRVASTLYLSAAFILASQLLIPLGPILAEPVAAAANATFRPLPGWAAFWPLTTVWDVSTWFVQWALRVERDLLVGLPDLGNVGRGIVAALGAAAFVAHGLALARRRDAHAETWYKARPALLHAVTIQPAATVPRATAPVS